MQTVKLRGSNGISRDFMHRGTPADVGVIQQIFTNQDYALKRLKRGAELTAYYHALVAQGRTPLIIDAGSNIGASVCWFGLQYPDCKLVGFEPEAKNYEILTTNAAGLNADLHNAAIGSANGTVTLLDPGDGEWAYRTLPGAGGNCRMMSIHDVLEKEMGQGCAPFIAKIDIEGGEENLFQEPNDWVDMFPLVIIELHDWLLPKQRTSQSFLRCISKFDRDFVHIGENIFSIRNG